MRGTPAALLLLAAACGGAECPPLMASAGDVRVTVMPEGGCGGTTWRADVVFGDGRTQALAGEHAGGITAVLLGSFAGDSAPDLAIAVEPGRVHAFVRQGGIFFGRELPPPPGEGTATITDGTLRVGSAVWDADAGVWRQP